MKMSIKCLIQLSPLLIMFASCQLVPAKQEVAYHNYSFKQLRGYLGGDWINKNEIKGKDSYVFWRFIFRSDSAGIFQNYEHRANGNALVSCPPVFGISKKGSKYIIKFTPMFPLLPNNGAVITTITDRKLKMIDRSDLLVYEKINFQK